MSARRWGWGVVASVVTIRFGTLGLSGYSQELGFLEAYYSLLATDLRGVLLAWKEGSGCRVLEEAPALSVEDHSLWVLDCGPGAPEASQGAGDAPATP